MAAQRRGRATSAAPAVASPQESDDDDDGDDGARHAASAGTTWFRRDACAAREALMSALTSVLFRIVFTVNVDLHPIGIIFKSNTIKGIRFSVSREHWRLRGSRDGGAVYKRLPERVVGACDRWSGRGKDDNKVHIEWESDGSNSDEWLCKLLRPSLGLQLLPNLRTGAIPKAKGAVSQRAYTVATTTGPYAAQQQPRAEEEHESVEVRALISACLCRPRRPRRPHCLCARRMCFSTDGCRMCARLSLSCSLSVCLCAGR